jgi:O-antigen/teichoic acid export membrane protein
LNGRGRVGRAGIAEARPLAGTARGAAGAIASQGLNAVSSLAIQVIGARALGVHGFGNFTLIYSVLISLTALYSGWVGDSLVVLDRAHSRIRAGIASSMCVWAVAAVAIGLVCGVIIGGSWRETLEISVLLTVWLAEETGRRLYAARRRYWALTGNDLVYNAVALLAIAAVSGGGTLTIETLLLCLIAGSSFAVLASVVTLPRAETRFPRPDVAGFREVAAFGVWRSLNVGVRPLGLLVARLLVAAAYGTAALSSMQVGWLLLAPGMVLVNGAGMFLLPFLREREASPGRLQLADLRRPIALLAAAAGVWAIVAIALSPALQRLLASASGPRFHFSRWVVVGWAAYVLAVSVALPVATALVAVKRPRAVLQAQLAETLVGLGLVVAICAFAPYWAVPYGLALGVAARACVTLRTASRVLGPGTSRSSGVEPHPADAPQAPSDLLGNSGL